MEGPNTPITDADFSVSLPVALFSVNVLGSLNPSDCAGYGFTISYNCVQEPMDSCYVNGPYSFGPPEGDVYILGAASDVQADAGTVVTITWGNGILTTNASLTGTTVYVWDLGLGQDVAVTPTLLAPSDRAAIPMWQQAIGRASATAPCPAGYTPSWDTWPNNHTGGYVCNTFVPAYGN